MWEIAGETTPPSKNDQITTSFGGSFLGESLFRMASLVLERGEKPGFWRELGAAFVSPGMGFTRAAWGSRFDGVFRSRDPAVYTRAQLGAILTVPVKSNLDLNPAPAPGSAPQPQTYQRGAASLDFNIGYGLPGKPGYRYDRAFDYFQFQFTAASSNAIENVIARGLLWGTDYAGGDDTRGVWGLFGTYDYIAPQVFRVSTTGAGVGTALQTWLSKSVALQTEIVGGGGYGSAGVIRGRGQRDYHNGITPQGLLSLRLILGDRLALDTSVRDYYVTDIWSDEKGGSENIARADAGLTLRVFGLHGVSVKYVFSHRVADYLTLPDTRQSVGAISIAYTYLGHRWFGAVDWRPDHADR
jgi:hypothetical protein